MTDVGKVTVGVEVNGSDLGAKLAAEIEKAVRPAIAAVNRQLDELNRKVNTLDGGGLDKLTVKARAAAQAIQSTGTASRDASLLITRSVDKSIRDYERLANAAERSANRQIAAAARVNAAQAAMGAGGGGGGRGGGGGGGFGNSDPRGFQRFTRSPGGGRGAMSFLGSPLGVNLGALAVGNIPAFTTAVVQAAGAVQQLSGIILLAPAGIAALGASLGTAILGFEGMGKAVKQFWQAFQDGDPKSLEKANELIKNMAPNAQSAVKSLAAVFPQLQALRQLGQQNMFEGMDKGITDLSGKLLPTLQKGIDQTSRAWNGTLKEMLNVAGNSSTQGFLSKIFGNTAEAQTVANRAIAPFVHAFGTLAAEGSDFLPRIAEGLNKVTRRFDEFITKAAADGRLDQWIDKALKGFADVGNIVLNIAKTIGNLTGAAGGDFLGWLRDVTERWAKFTGSAEGQQKFGDFFREGSKQLKALGDFLKPIMTDILPAIIEACARWSDVLMPFLTAATSLLGKFPGLLQGLLLGFIALRTIRPFTGIMQDLGILNRSLGQTQTAAQRAGQALGGAGGVAGGAGGAAGGLTRGQRFRAGAADFGRNAGIMVGANLGINGISGGNGVGDWLSTIGGGALTGASIGSLGGPWGAAIGAVVGGGLAAAIKGVNGALSDSAAETDKAAAAAQRYAQNMQDSRAAMEVTRQAIKDMNDALTLTGGAFDQASIGAVAEQLSQIPEKLKGSYDENTIKAITGDLAALNLTGEQMANIVTGSQSGFDSLIARLNEMGPAGAIAANQLKNIRDNALGASQDAATAAPLINQLATSMNVTADQAKANLLNTLDSLPSNVPINVSMPGGQDLFNMLQQIGEQITQNADGTISVTAPLADSTKTQLEALGYVIKENKDGTINVGIDPNKYAETLRQLGDLGGMLAQLAGLPPAPGTNLPGVNGQAANPFILPPSLQPPPANIPGAPPQGPTIDAGTGNPIPNLFPNLFPAPGPAPWTPPVPGQPQRPSSVPSNWVWDGTRWKPPGGAAGGIPFGHGVLPGYSPGVDNMLVPLSGGEGIVIPEAMRALGPGWLYGINSMFRSGLSKANYGGFDEGGINGPFGPLPGPNINGIPYDPTNPDDPVLKQLQAIKELLQGKQSGPLTDMQAQAVNSLGTPVGQEMGPFGTPIKKWRPYDAVAGALKGLGMDPDYIIGPDPTKYAQEQMGQLRQQYPGMFGGQGGGNASGYNLWDEVAKHESSGNWQNADTGNNGHYGGLQFSPSTWAAFGGLEFAPMPHMATREQQIEVANRTAFTGYNGTAPQGLGAWEVITKGLVPGVTTATPQSAFANAQSAQTTLAAPPPAVAPWTQPGSTAGVPAGPIPPGGSPPPGAVWMPGLNSWTLNGQKIGGTPPGPNQPTTIPPAPVSTTPPVPAATAPMSYGGTPDVHGASPYMGAIWQQIQSRFPGLQITAGKDDHSVDGGYHPQGMALDIGGDPAQMAQLANWLNQFAPYIQEMIHQGAGVSQNINSGKLGPAIDMPGSVYTTAQAGDHSTHDHLAVKPEMAQALLAAMGGSMPPGAFGMGGYGGYGSMGMGGGGLGAGGGVVPVYVVNMAGAQMGQVAKALMPGAQAVAGAAGEAVGSTGEQIIKAGTSSAFDALGANFRAAPGTPNASVHDLVNEGNPMALAAIAGFDVPDMSRNGQVGFTNEDITRNGGPQFDATGRLISNTSGLVQRSFTDLTLQMDAMRTQLVSATRGVSERLANDAIGPVFKSGVTGGISEIPNAVMANFGSEMGGAMAPQIADAVASSIPQDGGSAQAIAAAPYQGAAALLPLALAEGGGVWGGQRGKDSVPAMLMPGEWVLPTEIVDKMGGFTGMSRFTQAVQKRGGIRHMAAGGGVIGNDTVGAEWFGVDQVPVVGAIFNMFIRVLLGVLGVEIKVRDTLGNITEDFRTFRGKIQQFNSQGQLMNDTSGLAERSTTSEQTVVNERIRIMKIVLEALVKFIIEKIVVPLIKAVANAAINAGASAAGGAVGPFGGQAVSSFISSLGSAGVDIGAEIGSDIAVNFSQVLIDMIGSGLGSYAPGLMGGLLGGNVLGGIFAPVGGVLGSVLTVPLGLLAALFGSIGGANIGTGILNGVFDEGGTARGIGYMPKNVIQPERVLSPRQTESFDRLVDILASGDFRGGGSTSIHAPITLVGSSASGEGVRDSLLELMR